MYQRLSLASSLLLGAAITAQSQSTYQTGMSPNPLAVQVFAEPALPSPPTWMANTTDNSIYAALQYSSTAATAVTVLLAFVVPDPDYQPNVNVLAALRAIYPFIDHPTDYWTANHAALLGLNMDFDNESTAPVVIPPARIAAAVTAALGAPQSFGPVGVTSLGLYTRPAVGAGSWPSSVLSTDERHTLSGWWNEPRTIVRIDQLGRRALEVAAYQWSSLVDPDAVTEFDTMIRQTYQWAINLQTVEITPPTPTNPRARLKLSNPVRVRCRSLAAQTNDPWLAVMGPSRATVFLPIAGQRFNLAGLGELVFIDMEETEEEVGADCQAYVPIQGGGWAIQPRLTTFRGLNLPLLRPWTAVFACPANAVHGDVYLSKQDLTPIRVAFARSGTGGLAAPMFTFLPAEPIVE